MLNSLRTWWDGVTGKVELKIRVKDLEGQLQKAVADIGFTRLERDRAEKKLRMVERIVSGATGLSSPKVMVDQIDQLLR